MFLACLQASPNIVRRLTTMGLKTKDGLDIQDVWKDGVRTYLGIFVKGLPNAFLLYSPQGL